MSVQSAIKRMQQRSKLPTGSRIIATPCEDCHNEILCWEDDTLLTPLYPYRKRCSYCKEAERAFNRAIFSKKG